MLYPLRLALSFSALMFLKALSYSFVRMWLYYFHPEDCLNKMIYVLIILPFNRFVFRILTINRQVLWVLTILDLVRPSYGISWNRPHRRKYNPAYSTCLLGNKNSLSHLHLHFPCSELMINLSIVLHERPNIVTFES